MGLDQYGFKRKQGEKDQTIQTWRKHANLEGYMAKLYRAKGGKGKFNCKDLELTKDDLLTLQQTFENLNKAKGFFWGESQPKDDQLTEEFITKALQAIEEGYQVYYTSWW